MQWSPPVACELFARSGMVTGMTRTPNKDKYIDDAWHRFQLGQMLQSTRWFQPLDDAVAVVGTAITIQRYMSGEYNIAYLVALLTIFGISRCVQWWVKRTISTPESSDDTTNQWRACVLHQCAVSSLFLIGVTINAWGNNDTLVQHRAFGQNFFGSMFFMSVALYMPAKIHFIFVCVQGALVWIFFHWHVGFLKPVPLLVGIVVPAFEFIMFLYTQRKDWNSFCLVEQERALKDALWRVLNTMLDASCECDGNGRVLRSTPHLQELLWGTEEDLVSHALNEFAASQTEEKRMNHFFSQIAVQRQEGVAYSMAMLETILTRRASQLDGKTEHVKVKLCCVPLPGVAIGMTGQSGLEGVKIFVGFQKVPQDDDHGESPGMFCEGVVNTTARERTAQAHVSTRTHESQDIAAADDMTSDASSEATSTLSSWEPFQGFSHISVGVDPFSSEKIEILNVLCETIGNSYGSHLMKYIRRSHRSRFSAWLHDVIFRANLHDEADASARAAGLQPIHDLQLKVCDSQINIGKAMLQVNFEDGELCLELALENISYKPYRDLASRSRRKQSATMPSILEPRV